MKCELCKEQEATVHFKQVTGGDVRELWICRACAEHQGLDLQSPASLTDFFFGTQPAAAAPAAREPDLQCAGCGMKLSEFRKLSRLGCARCYETFAEELDEVMDQLQFGDQHVGKVPAREQLSFEIARYEDDLTAAVQRQDFEEAARLRDLLKDLRAQVGAGTAAGSAATGEPRT